MKRKRFTMLPTNTTSTMAEDMTCPAVGYQSASVCVPITVTPYAKTGATVTKCCGNPVVTPGRDICGGLKNGSCFFTISQDICVAVPVDFGAIATVGDTYVACNDASNEDICSACGTVVPPVVNPIIPEAPLPETTIPETSVSL